MTDDPIVAEIHRVREELARRFGNDLKAYGRHLRVLERNHPAGVIDLSRNESANANGLPPLREAGVTESPVIGATNPPNTHR